MHGWVLGFSRWRIWFAYASPPAPLPQGARGAHSDRISLFVLQEPLKAPRPLWETPKGLASLLARTWGRTAVGWGEG